MTTIDFSEITQMLVDLIPVIFLFMVIRFIFSMMSGMMTEFGKV